MTFSYVSDYDSSKLRGTDITERPWNLHDEIIKKSSTVSRLLDIGCGTAFKLIPLSNHFKQITGIDISQDMTYSAKKLIGKLKIRNIEILQSDSQQLPFSNHSFDLITSILSIWNVDEIYRVIKPQGEVIIEHIGCEDKMDFKVLFGKDEKGLRGQFINSNFKDYLQSFHDLFIKFFETVTIKNGYWKTSYNEQGLLELLKFTPTIRNFNEVTDDNIFKSACNQFMTENGITLTQNRILIHAKNPRFV